MVDYYKLQTLGHRKIEGFARKGIFNKEQIVALINSELGLPEKFVMRSIKQGIDLGKFIWVGSILRDLSLYEIEQEEKEKKEQEAQKKEMQELDDLFKAKAEK